MVHLTLLTYSFATIVFVILLSMPVIGLPNTVTSPNRIVGWAFYVFMDMFSPLILSTFWAFANSINSPERAKKSYWKMVAVSRFGGIICPMASWFVLNKTPIPHLIAIPGMMVVTAIFLLLASLCIAVLVRRVPKQYISSYESKQLKRAHIEKKKPKTGMIEGLKLMVQQPYVFGIFSMFFLYETISVVFDYQMQVMMSIESQNRVDGISSYMMLYTASFQLIGLIFAIWGTEPILKRFDVGKSLLVMPFITICAMLSLLVYPSLKLVFFTMVLLRAIHYGFNIPVSEILYIPTVKDVKFKSKSWIGSFGRTFAKTSGAAFNYVARQLPTQTFIRVDSVFALAATAIWTFVAVVMGNAYSSVIKSGSIIGVVKDDSEKHGKQEKELAEPSGIADDKKRLDFSPALELKEKESAAPNDSAATGLTTTDLNGKGAEKSE